MKTLLKTLEYGIMKVPAQLQIIHYKELLHYKIMQKSYNVIMFGTAGIELFNDPIELSFGNYECLDVTVIIIRNHIMVMKIIIIVIIYYCEL